MPDQRQNAVRIGRLVVVSQPDNRLREDLAASFTDRARKAWKTNHFHLFELPSGRALIIHPFSHETIDADLFSIAERELGDAGVVTSAMEYDQAVIAIVASISQAPQGERLAWRQLCLNTLAKLHRLLTCPSQVGGDSHIVQFAAIYQRAMELRVGDSLLDVGTSFGFLPILIAGRDSTATVLGCDLSPDALACAKDLAVVTQASRVTFLAGDVLAPDFPTLGQFDTVTAIHLLEHLSEEELARALANVLRTTCRRLVIAVPYEETLQTLYGHQQTFTAQKLRRWGRWCIESIGGGQFWCEEVNGGLLVVDRPSR